jgi:hypothetical protein
LSVFPPDDRLLARVAGEENEAAREGVAKLGITLTEVAADALAPALQP